MFVYLFSLLGTTIPVVGRASDRSPSLVFLLVPEQGLGTLPSTDAPKLLEATFEMRHKSQLIL